MKWGRYRRQRQEGGQQHDSSTFSFLRVLPLSWISKLNPATWSKPAESSSSAAPRRNGGEGAAATARAAGVVGSKTIPDVPEFRRPRPPPPPQPRFSRDRALRPSTVSDHLSFSPALLDRMVGRDYEVTDGSARRHSCANDEDAHLFLGGFRPYESARFHASSWSTERDFPRQLSCRSCRGDLESSYRWLSRQRHLPSPSDAADAGENDLGRPAIRDGRRGDEGERMKADHGAPAGEGELRRAKSSEKGRRQRSALGDDRYVAPRKSFSLRQKSRVKVYSPRAASFRAAKEIRNNKKKVADEEEEEEEEEETGRRRRRRGRSLESFAVVKCSTDPQEDFRESMVEMIRQNGIGRPDEMEGLLACYLALNSDEYHDVIVKVFRQVWLDLRSSRLLAGGGAALRRHRAGSPP